MGECIMLANKPTKVIDKKILVISTGLAGVGKTTHLKALSAEIANSVYLDKDVINLALLQGQEYFSDHYNRYVRMQSYEVMLQLAKDNLKQNKVVILDGYFGDKLSLPLFKDYLSSLDFTTKILYFHCSGDKQLERLQQRGDKRDKEKLEQGKFKPYRQKEINRHLAELIERQHITINTENTQDLKKNIETIQQYLLETPPFNNRISLLANTISFTEAETMQGTAGFNAMLLAIQQKKSAVFFSADATNLLSCANTIETVSTVSADVPNMDPIHHNSGRPKEAAHTKPV